MAKRLDAKARLLWRSDLVLIDGTRLPGLAIVSYANPFDGGIGGRDDTQGDNHEAEAELCLALEMLRNQPLHISAVTTDRGSAPVLGAASQKQSHWVASGEVRVYIDPRERATWSFFNRTFCFDADFVEDAGAESQIKSESSDLALSPTKAIKHRADRILSDLPRLNLSKQPTRIVVPKAERADSLDIPPVKTESVSPEPFSDTKPLLDTDTIEKTNRTTIKKITHTLLVREHNLTKSDPDYIASYHQTCAGTWCAFRHVASIKPLAKDAVETVVRIHLSLYLHSHRA
uniref:Uncharacterized protein n=1 Tax=Kalmanozyma brasiliensis (strain GHG001) TaxID=1365824 RepID=V5EWZ7_KALBG